MIGLLGRESHTLSDILGELYGLPPHGRELRREVLGLLGTLVEADTRKTPGYYRLTDKSK
jgi:hypothetical protein